MANTETPDSEKTHPNPARDLQAFLQELIAFPKGNQKMLMFLTIRYQLDSQDHRLVLKRMYPDMQLADRAIVATEAALGHMSSRYLQWKDNVLVAFSRVSGLESQVDHVRSTLDPMTMLHLDYCVAELDKLEPAEDLLELLEMIDGFREQSTSLNLSKDVVASIHENLQEMDDLVWTHFYRLEDDKEGVTGRVLFEFAELLRQTRKKEVRRFLKSVLTLAWRICLLTQGVDALPESDSLTNLLLPASSNEDEEASGDEDEE